MKFLSSTLLAVGTLVLPFTVLADPSASREVPMTNQLIVMSLGAAEDKVLQLAEAIPADAYGYTPMEGVANVGEVLKHLAGANYYISSMLGRPIPTGITPRELGEGVDKATLIEIYRASVTHAKQALEQVSAEAMAEEIEFFGMTAPRGRLALMVADHQHEHLGQLIAYARANHIVPPWSH